MLGAAKVPNANSFTSQWNIGFNHQSYSNQLPLFISGDLPVCFPLCHGCQCKSSRKLFQPSLKLRSNYNIIEINENYVVVRSIITKITFSS